MKAWQVKNPFEWCSMIVFAETRGEAVSFALHTDGFEDLHFTEIKVYRIKKADKYYTEGKSYMDWDNPQDKEILYDEFGYRCEYVEPFYCDKCPIKERCEDYQDTLEWESAE